jgi:hypothetical protein
MRDDWRDDGADAKQFFTLVFEGDLTKFPTSPLNIYTQFGKPVASALGDKLAKCERLEEEVSELNGKLGEAWGKYGR